MTYSEGLGAINIARTPKTYRDFLQSVAKPVSTTAPTPVLPTPVSVRPTTITFTPQTKPLPVLTTAPVAPKPVSSTPVFKATVPTPITLQPASSGAILTRTADTVVSTTDTALSGFIKSPLPLIAVGLGALWFMSRKKGR